MRRATATVSSESLVTQFTAFLKERGMRVTYERTAIAERVQTISSEFSFLQLSEMLETAGCYVSRATLYNTLRLLIEAGLLQRLNLDDGVTRYQRVTSKVRLRLVCDGCGKIKDTQDPGLITFFNTRRFMAFTATSVDLYVHGLCNTCARKSKRSRAVKKTVK